MLSSPFLPLVGQAQAPHWKAHLEGLAAEAKEKEEEWGRQKAELEDQLRSLKVRNMEAERLFKIQERQLDDRLERTQGALGQLEQEHRELQGSSADQLAKLRKDFGELQKHCDALEHERQALTRQLRDADITAAARQAAEAKVAELQDAISGMKQRTERVMAELQRQKDDVERARDLSHRQLEYTQQQLQQEEEARRTSEQQATLAALDWQRMAAALQLERLINEPLRHTDHATTTTSHVLSSYAAPIVISRFRDPSAPPGPQSAPCVSATTAAAAAPERIALCTGDGSNGSAEGEGIGAAAAAAAAAAGCLDRLSQIAHAGTHASSFLVPELDRRIRKPGRQQQQQQQQQRGPRDPLRHVQSGPAPTPGCARPSSADAPTLRHNDLTRLSRAWATTTPTAGFPHPSFLDNTARYKDTYQCRSTACPSRCKLGPRQKPSPAIWAAYHELVAPANGAQARPAQQQGGSCKHWAP